MKRKILVGVIVSVCIMAIVVPVVNTSSEFDNLKKGDLVYRSGALGFGHVGIYIGNGKVIEVVTKNALPPYGGAIETTLDDFKNDGNYWGAKTISELDENKRNNIIEFAKKAVDETKKGEIQYDSSHLHPKGEIVKNGRKLYDCVGFTEAAYESVDIDLVPGDRSLLWYLTPKGQMKSLKLKNVKSETPEGGDLGGVDFTDIHPCSIYSNTSIFWGEQFSTFSYALKAQKAEEGDKIIELEKSVDLSLNSFFIGLSIPDNRFWVNLNPWEPDRIIEKDLKNTDIGRIMLEADLQMKKDFCKYENPCESETGERYWRVLEEKGEELITEIMNKHPNEIKDIKNVLFRPVTRHWIVPDKVDAYETDNEIYIVNATLDIYSEPVYEHSTYEIVNQNALFISRACKDDLSEAAKEYGRYVKELEEEMILPLVVQEVNQGKNYSDLRCVYNSLALAQWYKNKYRYSPSIFTDFIDSTDLTGLESKSTWNAEDIWMDYKKSFEEGEYQCWKNETYQEGIYIITSTELYSSGGVDFMDIKKSNNDDSNNFSNDDSNNFSNLTSEAMYSLFAKDGNDYYFGDGLYVSYEGLEKAIFEFSNLRISPAKVRIGEPVTIEVDVKNAGNTVGTKTIYLEINGKNEGYWEITLAPDERIILTSTQIPEEAGGYTVTVGGQTGNFTVTP